MLENVTIVGAGFAGCVAARALADLGTKIVIFEKRQHIGGNAHDCYDKNGVLVHTYGPHIFHTNSERIVRWLSRFTDWRFYEHRVLAQVDGAFYPIPINRTTINTMYGLAYDEAGIEKFLEMQRQRISEIKSSEDVVLNSVGIDLCNKFFRGYTKKQWGIDLSELSPGVAARIPTRFTDDDRYFSDSYQFMPSDGYSKLFARMIDHPNIELQLGVDFLQNRSRARSDALIYTGPIDEYYDYRFGKLPYRSLEFVHEHIPGADLVQKVGTINYPNEHEFTRITEFKHLTGQKIVGTSIVKEYPKSGGEPFYPIPREENDTLYRKYKELSDDESNVYFVGRLAQYKYFNMDQVVGASLALASQIAS
jgi:UDP-galactopyranose mutase